MPLGNDVAGLRDNRIAGAARTERKWSAKTSVDQAEGRLHLRDIIVNTNTGRQGVRMSHFRQWSSVKASGQKGAPWSRQKCAAQRKIKGKQGQQYVENRGPGWSGIYQSESLHGQNYGRRTSLESRSCWGKYMTRSYASLGCSRRPKLASCVTREGQWFIYYQGAK